MNSETQNSSKIKRMGLTLKWSKIGPLFVAPALLISGCGLVNQQPTPTPIPLPSQNSSTQVASSETFSAVLGDISNYATYSGKVAVAEEEDLFFRRSGRVQAVLVEDGDPVEKDTLIAELDTAILNIDLESASIAVEIAEERLAKAEQALVLDKRQAELSLEITKLTLESYQARAEENSEQIIGSGYRLEEGLKIQERQLEKAQIVFDRIEDTVDPILELNLQRAELQLNRVKESLLDSKIRAPFDGEVRFITLPEDDKQVAASAYIAVARVINPDSLSIELNLSRTQLESLAEGMPVSIRTSINSGEVFEGEIDSLPRPFGSGIGTLTYVSITNDADRSRLIEGTTVDVQIELGNKEGVLTIPVAALQGIPGQQYVYASDSSGLQKTVDVEIGIQNDEFVEIVSGLVEGQSVVTR